MSRTEKGSRIKFLPAREQKSILDTSSSFPTKHRTTGNSRTGKFNIFFDESKIIDFGSNKSDVIFPIMLKSGSSYLNTVSGDELATGLSGSANITRGLSDKLIRYSTIQLQDFTPFHDEHQFAVDGKIQSGSVGQNSFYLTGSAVEDVGPGFTQPLWSKTKIEIDLTPASTVSMSFRSGSGEDNSFCYFNFGTKLYDPVGSTLRWDQFLNNSNATDNWFLSKSWGFSPSTSPSFFPEEIKSAATPMENFGFPNANKYFVSPTSSLLYPMSNSISEPFLLEKIVLYVSAAFTASTGNPGTANTDICYISTFFIMNQKRPGTSNEIYTVNDALGGLVTQFTSSHTSGTMDLISAMQISAINTSMDADSQRNASRDFNIYGAPPLHTRWNSYITLSSSVKSPTKNIGIGEMFRVANSVDGGSVGNSTCLAAYTNGGRTGRYEPCGRNFRQLLPSFEPTGRSSALASIFKLKKYYEINPYILLPTDTLIFGWQVPLPQFLYNTPLFNHSEIALSIAPQTCKVVFYGSLLRDNKEFHDTSNETLNTNNIVEVIG